MGTTDTPRGTLDTHFLEGRRYRVDEIGEVLGHRNWWRMATFVAMGWGILATLGMLYLGSLPKHVPWPIRWDSASGAMQPLALAPQAGEEPVTIRLWLREFVTTLRAVSTDKEWMRQQWHTITMTRLTPEGKQRFVEYAKTWKPLTQPDPIAVEVLSVLRQTRATWEVRWRETQTSGQDGAVRSVKTYRGLFVFQHRAPRTMDELEYNPAGIFFHEWSWSDAA